MLNEIIFLVLSAVILGGAIKMLIAEEPVHSAVYLGLVLGGVAGIYLTLSAEFLAAIQILIYVGAVVTLILFAVMLTTHASPTEGFAEDRTPLSTLGFEDAPPGMDVESLEEVPAGAETVEEAETHARDERDDEDTVRRDLVDDEPDATDGADDESADEAPGTEDDDRADEAPGVEDGEQATDADADETDDEEASP